MIHAIWHRIRSAVAVKSPRTAATLGPPATEGDIVSLQDTIGLVIPGPLRDSLLIHNGQIDPSRTSILAPYGTLMSAGQIAAAWEMTSSVDAGLRDSEADWDSPSRPEWWNKNWIPFFDLDGDYYCINMNPYDRFARGSETVVRFVHDNPHEANVAASYIEWLESVATLLESRRTTADDHGYLLFEE